MSSQQIKQELEKALAPIIAHYGIRRVLESIGDRLHDDAEAIVPRHGDNPITRQLSANLEWLSTQVLMALQDYEQQSNPGKRRRRT